MRLRKIKIGNYLLIIERDITKKVFLNLYEHKTLKGYNMKHYEFLSSIPYNKEIENKLKEVIK